MQQFVQLFNLQLNVSKTVVNALCQIVGLSFFRARDICQKFGFNHYSLLRDVSRSVLMDIRQCIAATYTIQGGLRKQYVHAVQEFIQMKRVRGFRHKLKLPVRGQRTRSNHKTQKQPRH